MDINTNSNIASTLASSLQQLNIQSISSKRETNQEQTNKQLQELNSIQQAKEDDMFLVEDKASKSKIDVAEIKLYAKSMGEELTIDDINYGLQYGRSVIADYSA